ncbi:MAG TPA: 8-amino-7-oxononanoate synthase [Tepidisphaeraceae bacterium]|nr:8-amino-7-oxononanoate synthase [Tepidisphaeraceae bacterium]
MGRASSHFEQLLLEQLRQRQSAGLLRSRRIIKPIDSLHLEIDGRPCVNFCSNDYLALSHHPRLIAAIEQALHTHGAGSGAAGLISGHSDLHAAAEKKIAQWKKMQSCVLLPSGYQANHAAVQTLAALIKPAGGRFLADKLIHASLLDAVRGTDVPMRVYPHNNLRKLRRLLSESHAGGADVVVSESIFSMDGDAADLAGLAELKREFPFVLLLDEAHATGVYGASGAGLAAEAGFQAEVDVSVVTLSKSLGLVGGAVCGSEEFCQAVLNFGRAYIYSTSVPAFIAAGVQAAIEILHDQPQRQRRLRDLAANFRKNIANAGLKVPPGDSPIVPIMLGSSEKAVEASDILLEKGILVLPVRPPTVPRGASRLRVTLSCDHSVEEVSRLGQALAEMRI